MRRLVMMKAREDPRDSTKRERISKTEKDLKNTSTMPTPLTEKYARDKGNMVIRNSEKLRNNVLMVCQEMIPRGSTGRVTRLSIVLFGERRKEDALINELRIPTQVMMRIVALKT